MQSPEPDLPDPAQIARTLQAMISEMPQPSFAALDGALFDDLPGDLLSAGFSCRSLFLEHGDADVERAGPWLLALGDERARNHAQALAIAQPCAVFWSCAEGEMALWRHLRTINEVLIPLEDAEGGAQPAGPAYERVMFRHWDPNVLAAVMPQLDVAQFARVFGPAGYILMNATDTGGLKRVPRPENLPPPHGPLRIRAEQTEGVANVMVRVSRLRDISYLRRAASENSRKFSDSEMVQHVEQSLEAGRELGLKSKKAHWKWSYLMLPTNGGIGTAPRVRSVFASSPYDADTTLDIIMRDTISHLRKGGS